MKQYFKIVKLYDINYFIISVKVGEYTIMPHIAGRHQ